MGQLIFLVGGFLLGAALVPTVLARGGPQLSTSLLTGGVLAAYTGTFAVQHQYVSALGLGVNTVLWGVLAVQAVKQRREG